MFPTINKEIRTSFRWYRRANLRNRHVYRCGDEGNCVYAVPIPSTQMIPFQLLAGIGATYGQSTPTQWRVKNLSGTQVANLDSMIGSLQVVQLGSPQRDIIILAEPLTLPVQLQGEALEMEITTAGGTYYSETFKPMCAEENGAAFVQNPSFVNGSTGWYYGNWSGFLTGVVEFNIELPGDAEFGDTYLVTDDANIYTWNGSSYDAVLASEDVMYSAGVGQPWYYYDGSIIRVATEEQEPVLAGGMPCWQDIEPVSVFFDLGAQMSGEQLVRFYVRFVSIDSGTMDVYVDGVQQLNLSTGSAGDLFDFELICDTDSVVEFRPSEGFAGCMSSFSVFNLTSIADCYHLLKWRSCGDVGNVRYVDTEFTNYLYLPASDKHFLGKPSPQITTENEDAADGGKVQTFVRIDTDWTLDALGFPWWLLDALTTLPAHDEVTLQLAGETEEDELINIRTNYEWADTCIAKADIVFQVDDPTIKTGCCDTFDPACISTCTTVYGIQGVHDLVEGEVYARSGSKTYATYLGFGGPPVDEEGFGTSTPCTSGLVQTQQADIPYAYFGDSGEWFTAANIDDIGSEDCEVGYVTVSANIMGAYAGQLQWSEDGTTWNDLLPAYPSAQWGSGVEILVPEEAQLVRIKVVGPDCPIAYSPAVAAPCGCIAFNLNDNLQAQCGSYPATITVLFIPTSMASLPAMGITVQADYRTNGGSWIPVTDLQVTGDYWAGGDIPYENEGDEVEVRVRVAGQFGCAYSMDTFICEP